MLQLYDTSPFASAMTVLPDPSVLATTQDRLTDVADIHEIVISRPDIEIDVDPAVDRPAFIDNFATSAAARRQRTWASRCSWLMPAVYSRKISAGPRPRDHGSGSDRLSISTRLLMAVLVLASVAPHMGARRSASSLN